MHRKKYFGKQVEMLKDYIKKDKPHLNSSYKKEDLCTYLDLSPMQLHTMLTRNFESSYIDFMNKLRVEEAKKILADPNNQYPKKTDIATQSGFGSMSQFNVQFKKITGMTPSEYEVFYRQFKKITGESPDQFSKESTIKDFL